MAFSGRVFVISLASLLLLSSSIAIIKLGSIPPASATFPGKNGRIAFVSDRDGNSEIYAMNSNGTAADRLTKNPAHDSFPKWSPDGTKIAFVSNRDGNDEIYVMNADGSDQKRLTNNSAIDADPAWSPDGSKIVFVSVREGLQGMFIMNADGTSITRLSNSSSDMTPNWSPDGSKILFISSRDRQPGIFVMSPDGTGIARLASFDSLNGVSPADWSPDGSKIVFVKDRDGNDEIYVMNADGSNATNVPMDQPHSFANWPRWSPDGSKIVFGEYGRIYTMDADGANVTRLTNNFQTNSHTDFENILQANSQPDWGVSPDVPSVQPILTVNTVDLKGKALDGIWSTISDPADGTLLKSGFTPLSFVGNTRSDYNITVTDYDGKQFVIWQDNNSTQKSRVLRVMTSNPTLTAIYDTGDSLRGFTPLTYTGTVKQPDLTIRAAPTNDTGKTLHVWMAVDPQSTNSSGTTYKVYATDGYKNFRFDHWDNGSTDRIRTLTIGEPTTITAYYKIGHGQHPKVDFNGDGHEDLAIGVPDEGAVNVVYGSSPSGISTTALPPQKFSQGKAGIEGVPKANDAFGHSVAAGDFNGDGISDLAVGAPGDDYASPNSGSVNVIYGSPGGLSANATQPDQILTGNSSRLNDILLSTCTPPQVPDLPIQGFGKLLAVGDFNGDGYDDLAVMASDPTCLTGQSSIGEFYRTGSLHIFYGSSLGLSNSTAHEDQYAIGGQISQYGTLATGDFNNDGKDDLAAADPDDFCCSGSAGPLGGFVDIFYGNTSGFQEDANGLIRPSQHWARYLPYIQGIAEGNEHFGAALATGDFNGDNYGDIAIGVPNEDPNGAVNVIYGSPSGLSATSTPNQLFTQHSLGLDGVNNLGDAFGSALSSGDFNGDGKDDLAIGAPGKDVGTATDAGSSIVIYGSSGGLNTTGALPPLMLDKNSTDVEGTAKAGDFFGSAIISGDFNNDGKDDLAIGSHSGGEGTAGNAGSWNIIYGSASGISPTAAVNDSILDLNSLTVNDATAGIASSRID